MSEQQKESHAGEGVWGNVTIEGKSYSVFDILSRAWNNTPRQEMLARLLKQKKAARGNIDTGKDEVERFAQQLESARGRLAREIEVEKEMDGLIQYFADKALVESMLPEERGK